jgi:MFS family permease
MSYIPLLPGYVQDTLHRGSSAYGFLLGMTGLGAITGSLLVSYLVRFYRTPNIIRVGFLSLGLLLIGFAAFRQLWLVSLIVFGLGVSFIIAGTAASSMLLNGSVREMRGRISSLFAVVYVGLSAIGGYFLAYIADVRTIPFSLALGGAACIAVTFVLVFFPGLVGGPGECEPGTETCTPLVG